MMTRQQSDEKLVAKNLATGRVDIERLEQFLNETVSEMAASTNLKPEEALEILENVHVEMVGELREAVETVGNVKNMKLVDTEKLSQEIEKAIAAISNATDLDTDEITTIFSKNPGASLADISYKLHEKSKLDRIDW